MNNEEFIWNYFKNKGLPSAGIAGLMGNLYAESGLNSINLQNSFEKDLKMTDIEYTNAVDKGSYKNFVNDKAGYGLAQWTFWSRKQNLLNFCKSKKQSIGSLQAQLDFLYQELTTNYLSVWKTLQIARSVKEASNEVLFNFERPKDQGASVQATRAKYGQVYYDKYAKKEMNTMSNSSLVVYQNISPNKNILENKAINRISIHCYVGQVTAQQGVEYFMSTSRQASCNYVVGYDGSIGLSVEEKDRSWCTSSFENDTQAITIEVASERQHPYEITKEAYEALIELLVDICKRNGKNKLLWINDKTKALEYSPKPNEIILTVHRWFKNKACPGEYLYNKHGEIAAMVTDRLSGAAAEEDEDMTQEKFNELMNGYLASLKEQPATYEQDALVWAQKNGLMVGDQKGSLMPKHFLTRGEFAIVLKRYAEQNNVD